MTQELKTGIKFKKHYFAMAGEINKIAQDNQINLDPSWSEFKLSLQEN
jgi:hypothetical protein